MLEYTGTHHFCVSVAIREQPPDGLRFTVPLFFELQHGRARGDFDFAVDDGALGDGNRASADLAAYHRGIAYFQFVPDVETSRNLAGDDGLLRLDEAVPASRGGYIEPALQIAVAVHFAGHHEMPRAADIADEHGFGADKSRSRRVAFEKSPFLLAHGAYYPIRGRP